MRSRPVAGLLALAVLASGSALASVSLAQAADTSARRASSVPARDTMIQLTTRPITVNFENVRLEQVMKFIADSSGADIEPLWIDHRNDRGLSKDLEISVRVDNQSMLTLIERVLEKAQDGSSPNTWQMTPSGTIQLGPKERLNKYRRLEIYDIHDLLLEVPDFRDAPTIDLQQSLQAAANRGGGGGQSPFQNDNENDQQDRDRREQRKREIGQELQNLIRDLCEPEQWVENGGTGGSMTYNQGTLIINAPDYMHRAINGYKWWPSTSTRVSAVDGRRSVTLTADTGVSRVNRITPQPVVTPAPGGGGR